MFARSTTVLPQKSCAPALSFFFNDTTTTEIYTLSLHDALPILADQRVGPVSGVAQQEFRGADPDLDRKSTRLNSSHVEISYAVFCLKKKTGRLIRALADEQLARIRSSDCTFVFHMYSRWPPVSA